MPPAHRDFESLASPGPHYEIVPYIDRFGEALLASDLVVARAGGSVFEIAAHGRPAVLSPTRTPPPTTRPPTPSGWPARAPR